MARTQVESEEEDGSGNERSDSMPVTSKAPLVKAEDDTIIAERKFDPRSPSV